MTIVKSFRYGYYHFGFLARLRILASRLICLSHLGEPWKEDLLQKSVVNQHELELAVVFAKPLFVTRCSQSLRRVDSSYLLARH